MKPGVSWVQMHDIATRTVLAALVNVGGRVESDCRPPRDYNVQLSFFCLSNHP